LYDATIDIIEKDPDRIFSLQEIQDVLIKDVSQKIIKMPSTMKIYSIEKVKKILKKMKLQALNS
jgi:hypothetical protein